MDSPRFIESDLMPVGAFEAFQKANPPWVGWSNEQMSEMNIVDMAKAAMASEYWGGLDPGALETDWGADCSLSFVLGIENEILRTVVRCLPIGSGLIFMEPAGSTMNHTENLIGVLATVLGRVPTVILTNLELTENSYMGMKVEGLEKISGSQRYVSVNGEEPLPVLYNGNEPGWPTYEPAEALAIMNSDRNHRTPQETNIEALLRQSS